MSRERIAEEEIGAAVQAWLEARGWTVYPEVAIPSSTNEFIDMVATAPGQGGHGTAVWAIECKVQFGWAVLDQACRHLKRADFVSVATLPARFSESRSLALRALGIGWLQIGTAGYFGTKERVFEQETAARQTVVAAWHDRLLGQLCPEQQTRGLVPGCVNGGPLGRVTAYSLTCDRMRAFVEANPRCSIKQIVRGIEHHYANASSAEGALRKWAAQGKIAGVATVVEHGRTLFVPASPEPDEDPDEP